MDKKSNLGLKDVLFAGGRMISKTCIEAHLYVFCWSIGTLIAFLIPLWSIYPDIFDNDILVISFVTFINMFLFTCITKITSDNDEYANLLATFMDYITIFSILIIAIYCCYTNFSKTIHYLSRPAIIISITLVFFAFIHYLYQTYTVYVMEKINPEPILGDLKTESKSGGRQA